MWFATQDGSSLILKTMFRHITFCGTSQLQPILVFRIAYKTSSRYTGLEDRSAESSRIEAMRLKSSKACHPVPDPCFPGCSIQSIARLVLGATSPAFQEATLEIKNRLMGQVGRAALDNQIDLLNWAPLPLDPS